MVQTLNGHAASPTFTAPIQASQHFIHRGSMNTLIGGQNGDRAQGDFLQIRIGAQGEARISYSDTNNLDEALVPHGMFVQQNAGDSLFVASSPVNIPGLAPFNSVVILRRRSVRSERYEQREHAAARHCQLEYQ
jgi:hypothetical protein